MVDPSLIGVRLASGAVAPLLKRLLVTEQPGAGLVSAPLRLSGWLSFRGERRSLGEAELDRLVAEVVSRAARSGGGEAPSPEVQREVADALRVSLHRLGDLDMDDVQAVRLGPENLALRVGHPGGMSADADVFFQSLLRAVCLHILNFFTQRSTFVARTLVEQTTSLDRLVRKTDLLLERIPAQTAEDARFEQRYAEHMARRHGELTLYGLDLRHTREWPLDAAYVSLEAESGSTALPAEQALRDHDRVLLRGGAGSGKTTLVQWLAVTCARQRYRPKLGHLIGRVPFVLPLRRILHEGLPPTPDRFLHAVRSSLAAAQPPGWADRVLAAGRALLLVDGIDEIPEREREQTRRWLRDLLGDHPGNLWLVTSRPSAVRDDWLTGDGFTELALAPMDRSDVAGFVRRWHTAADAGQDLAESLLRTLRAHGDLGRLAASPLMCGLLCALHREHRGFLPHSRRDLYDAVLSMLLERRDSERAVHVEPELRLSRETQVQLLQKLAHWMIRNDRTELDRVDAVGQLDRGLTHMAHVTASAEQVLGHLLTRSGMLREPAPGCVAFVHRTFQDHLGAKALVEEGDFPLLLGNAHRSQWEDVFRLAVAHARPAERARILTGLIAEAEPDDVGGLMRRLSRPEDATDAWPTFRRIVLAGACLEHATELDPRVRARVVALTHRLLPPPDALTARQLGDFGGPLLLDLLPGPECLTDREATHVVVAASRLGTDAAVDLLARFREHPALSVRRQLAWAWRYFDTDRYAAEVIAGLDDTGLYVTAHHLGHLKALQALGGRARVQLAWDYDPAEVRPLLAPERLTHLWLRDGYRSAGGEPWLTDFPQLEVLLVPDQPGTAEAATLPTGITVVQPHGPLRPSRNGGRGGGDGGAGGDDETGEEQ
ncbi:NACHT domain-containing protein [Streptomyces sp. 549]|uniref:NACHT domain-containing protein n=1 Tax=Streptomyces sp. 549 TaxID=3049076 RepID=UPI0024C3470D|nr:NACHT domain-containing protein [Streptomyces sp. 549]MDK1472353.1 NACHT domain-containing protein [Streptomyces sp. 549]